MLVIHDEVELPFGEVRLKEGQGLGGHNGLRSLEQCLGSRDFWRVRVGVGRPARRGAPLIDHVLAPFTEPREDVLAAHRAGGRRRGGVAGRAERRACPV